MKRLLWSLLFIIIVSAIGIYAYVEIRNVPLRGKVSIAFDDGLLSTYTLARPIMQEYGIRGTAYVYPQAQVDKFLEGFMNWEQVRSLQFDYEWEVGSHTYSHPYLTELSESEAESELERAYNALAAHGIKARGFASPFGDYNQNVLSYISRYYSYHRNAFGGTFNAAPYQDYALNAVEVAYGMDPKAVKDLIDKAMADDLWLILYWHDIVPVASSELTYSEDDFREIMKYITRKPIKVVTVEEGLNDWGRGVNMVVNGNFEFGSYFDVDGWIRHDENNVLVVDRSRGNLPLPKRGILIRGGRERYEILSEPIAVDAARHYRLRSLFEMKNFKSGNGGIWISEFDKSDNYIEGQWLGDIAEDFIGVKYFDYEPKPNTVHIEIFFYTSEGSDFLWYIDNVEMKLAP